MVICFDEFHAKKVEKIARLRMSALSLRETPTPFSEAGYPATPSGLLN
jgi:hypothetical protein